MASAKKKSATKMVSKPAAKTAAKPSKLQSLTKMLLGGGSKKTAKPQAKAAPAKAAAKVKAAPAAKPAKAAPAPKAAKVAASPAVSTKGKVAAPVVAVGKKGAAVAAVAPVATKAAANGKAAKIPRAPKLPARLFLETGTLLLGNPDGACREVACENSATTAGYCRGHYIKNWKKIKAKEQILREGRLNQYLEELLSKYPDKYIDAVKLDLASEKEFAKVITDLDLDESSDDFDSDQEPMENIIDTIKRDFEDETETF